VPTRCFVVDVAIEDLDAAADIFTKILGIEGVRMNPAQDPTGELDAFHFPVGGLNALGLMALRSGVVPNADSPNFTSRCLATRGEGISLLGHIVFDIEAKAGQLADAGIPMDIGTPTYYADGYLLITKPIHGVAFEFSMHHSDAVSELWAQRRVDSKGALVKQAYTVDVAVRDLDDATRSFRQFYDMDGIPLGEDMEPSGSVAGLQFPIAGLHSIGLVSPKGTPSGRSAETLASYLGTHGDGAMLIGFTVEDIDETQKHLDNLGIPLEYPEPQRNALGRFNVTTPVHGVHLQFLQSARAE
jgi:catechol 2,3-dioxygenase-like lactoylglutathione lyase family enzyme